jgi:hypothetical protein
MTHTLIKRGQARGQGGFAIGLILLVVLLIAIIIAAIALATRNSSNKGNEKDRVAASNLIQQAVTLDQGVQRISSSNGAPAWSVFTSRDSLPANGSFNLGNNLFGANGAYGAHPDVDTSVFDGKCANTAGAGAYVNIVSDVAGTAADKAVSGCQWHVTTVWGASALAAAGYNADINAKSSVGVLYTFPIKGTIASQINNILWGSQIGDQLFIVGAANSTGYLGKNVPVNDTPDATQPTVQPGLVVSTVPQTGVSSSTAKTTFNMAFGRGPSVTTTPRQIAQYNVAVTPGTTVRFPYIASAERTEGVVGVGVSKVDTDVIEPVASALTGVRIYYRNLNLPVAD